MKPLLPTAVVLLFTASCHMLFIESSVITIEVADRESELPAQDVDVRATTEIRRGPSHGETIATVAPTNATGRTLVPLRRSGERPFDGVLTIVLGTEGDSETLIVDNRVGSVATGARYAVRVVSGDGVLPPPKLEAIVGSRPPLLRIEGYASVLGVCSNTADRLVWQVTASKEAFAVYHDLGVEVGAVPPGYVDVSLSTLGTPRKCPITITDLTGEFTFFSINPLGNDVNGMASYCIEDDSVVSCP